MKKFDIAGMAPPLRSFFLSWEQGGITTLFRERGDEIVLTFLSLDVEALHHCSLIINYTG